MYYKEGKFTKSDFLKVVRTMGYSEKLVELRGKRTQAEVSEACGITQQSLCMYEKGERTPRDEVKKKLADYYGVTVGSIFFAE